MKGQFAPSSSDTFLTVAEHSAINLLPSSIEPVKDTFLTPAFDTIELLTASPSPVKTDNTPRTITLAQALTDLQKAVADPDSSEKQLKEQMAMVRAARQKAKAEALAAQKDLLQLLTTEQEATLVGMGVMD